MNNLAVSLEKFDERWIACEARYEKNMAASRVEFDERMGKLAAFLARVDERSAAFGVTFEERTAASRAEFDARIDQLLTAQENSDKKIDKLADEHAATERSLKGLIDGLQKRSEWKTADLSLSES